MSVSVDISMTIGGRGVCVEAWLVWGCRLLSPSDDVSLVCTESVIVLAWTVATLW